jgi:hypothetical protein
MTGIKERGCRMKVPLPQKKRIPPLNFNGSFAQG